MWDFANEPNSRNNEGDSFRTASPNPTTAPAATYCAAFATVVSHPEAQKKERL
jgi:hypothetical protein